MRTSAAGERVEGPGGAKPPGETSDLLDEVTRAIASLEAHPDPAVREMVQALLTGIDAVHRAGLTHLVQAIHAMAGDAFLNRLTADPAIRLLLMSYNLVAVDRRLQAEEALDGVRGHLHDHGIDVEMLEVVGGVVYVRLHRAQTPDDVDEGSVRRDLEAALKADFVGFQELVFRDGRSAPDAMPLPVTLRRRADRPRYFDAIESTGLTSGTMTGMLVNSVPVLLANVGGDVLALRNQCGDGPLPLQFGRLEGSEIVCPWHGCRYDARTGHRTDGQDGRIQVYPVTVADGRVRVALDVEPAGDSGRDA